MQADEFEKKVRAKLEKLDFVPNREVWKQVSLRIDREKNKRRMLVFWIFTGLLLLAGTSAYLIIDNENNNKTVISEINKKSSKGENYQIKQSSKKPLRSLEKIQKIHLEKSITHLPKADTKQASERKTSDLTKNEYAEYPDKKPLLIKKKEDVNIYKKEEKYVEKRLPLHKFYNPNAATVKIDTALLGISRNKKKDFKKDNSVNTAVKKNIDKKTGKKWKIGFTVYGGISDNISGLLSTDKTYSQDYFSSPVNYNNGNSGNPVNSGTNLQNSFKSTFSFGFGFLVTKLLTKTVSFSTGIDYHFYNAESMVGKSVNSPTAFYDSVAQANNLSGGYYTGGDSVKYANKYQLLELPINILLQLNKNQKKPLLLSAAISPGYLIASNALYANQSANIYYTDKEKFHRFQLSAHSSLLFPVANSNKYFLNVGPVIQYGFTNVAKAVTRSSQHLFFIGIKANIILK